MNLTTWTADLAARGLTALPPSTAVPVELYAVLPDGDLLHFRARGTTVTLRRYAADDVSVVLPTAYAGTTPEALAVADVRALPDAVGAGRVLLPAHARPVAEVAIDGTARFGWTGFEAGLCRSRWRRCCSTSSSARWSRRRSPPPPEAPGSADLYGSHTIR